MKKEVRKQFKAEKAKTERGSFQDAVGQFEKITKDMAKLEVRMRELSAQKLLENFFARDPDPQLIYSFFRVTEELHQGWSALLEKGKAPTRQAKGHASVRNSVANSATNMEEKPSKKPVSKKS
jgi:hypothetical protein